MRNNWREDELLLFCENAGVELHDFAHVGQEIGQAVVAGIRMIFVLHAFRLQLPVQGGGAIFESEVILLAAVEVDCQISQAGLIFAGQDENTVFLPVRHVDRFAEGRSQQSA